MINNIVDVEQDEIDREKFNFEFFEIDMKIELATKTIFDLMIDSRFRSIEIEFELKLIAYSSNLNDLTDLLNLIFDCDLKTIFFVSITICLIFVFDSKLTTTSTTTISCSIAFWTTIMLFNVWVNKQSFSSKCIYNEFESTNQSSKIIKHFEQFVMFLMQNWRIKSATIMSTADDLSWNQSL